MKNIIIILTIFLGFVANAQDLTQNQIPDKVLHHFAQQFPNAMDVDWEMDGNLYNVDFEVIKGYDQEIWYNLDGKMIKHKQEISPANLPTSIKEVIKNKFSDYTIDDVDKYTENNTITYKVEIKKPGEEMNVFFSETGEINSLQKN